MEKKGNSCPMNVCKAFSGSPAFQAIRRISHRLIYAKHLKSRNREAANDAVPISFDYSRSANPAELTKKNTQLAKVASKTELAAAANNINGGQDPVKGANKVKSQQVKLEKIGKSGVHIEDRFTDYINSAKIKIGCISNSDEGKNLSAKDSKSSEDCTRKDQFSDYIDRIKKKLRTTSGIGAGKNISFK